MNLCDAYVTKVIGEPVLKYGKWFLEVEYLSWSITPEKTELMFSSLEEAQEVEEGFWFLA